MASLDPEQALDVASLALSFGAVLLVVVVLANAPERITGRRRAWALVLMSVVLLWLHTLHHFFPGERLQEATRLAAVAAAVLLPVGVWLLARAPSAPEARA